MIRPLAVALLLVTASAAAAQRPNPGVTSGGGLRRGAVHYGKWLTDKGWIRGGDALQTSAQATTVRLRKGETLTTDGPFAETKEQLGGYYEVECQNLDQAIEAASRIPSVGTGSIEVRPIMEFDTPHK